MNDALTNKGVSITGDMSLCNSQNIVVVGAARGGTSMVAGALHHLGVFTGDKSVAPVFEDVRLSECFERKDNNAVAQVIDDYNAAHPLWAWKRPSSIDYLEDVHKAFKSPRYIFIYKDIMSIAQRNAISMLADLLPGMEVPLRQYAKTLNFLRQHPVHAMLVSYEKVISNSDEFVQELVRFSGVQANADQIAAAKNFITPNPEQYLDASRITKAQGRLGGIKGNKVFGWARMVHSKKPALVEIFLNDEKLGEIIANRPRPDLLERFNQACGFSLEIPVQTPIKTGDVLRARVVHEVRDLENSPFKVLETNV